MIPYEWGTTGIAYNGSDVTTPPATWADLADPQYHGKVALVMTTATSWARA